jgi:putative ABC transport system permease protein
MISLLLQVNRHIEEQMENNVRGVDMVVGAKGSPLQLILSAVYHIDAPTGNISLHEAEQLKKNRLIASGIPLSYGDNYNGYRIVGTTHAYPQLYGATVVEGRLWQEPFEVTIGAKTANILDIKIGDSFVGAHGLTQGGEAHGDHTYTVVGILGNTNSVLDQLILTATESVWEVHHHQEEEENVDKEEEHDPHAHERIIKMRCILMITKKLTSMKTIVRSRQC